MILFILESPGLLCQLLAVFLIIRHQQGTKIIFKQLHINIHAKEMIA